MYKTAFRMGTGCLYEYTRMPFGLCNAPATFVRLMDAAFGDQNFRTLLTFMDDVLVYGSTFEETVQRLELVLTRLGNLGLKVKPSKCSLFQEKIKYLGHIVTGDGISPDSEKVAAVRNYKVPTSRKEVRSFLGLVGYYRRFIPGFAKRSAPLRSLLEDEKDSKKTSTKKGPKRGKQPLIWTEQCQTAFDSLKEKLVNPLILGYPDFTRAFILETDASDRGLVAVLSQEQDGKRRVIAYASRGLRPTERNMDNYSSFKLELLALKWAVTEKFREYLLGAKATIYTDNNPLTYIKTVKLGAVETRWVAQLAQFDFEVRP